MTHQRLMNSTRFAPSASSRRTSASRSSASMSRWMRPGWSTFWMSRRGSSGDEVSSREFSLPGTGGFAGRPSAWLQKDVACSMSSDWQSMTKVLRRLRCMRAPEVKGVQPRLHHVFGEKPSFSRREDALGSRAMASEISDEWRVLRHGPLVQLSDNLWWVEGEIPRMSLKRVMTVVRRSDGTLVIHSAIAMGDKEQRELEALGTPAVLLVPNGMHRLDAPAYKKRYPTLRVYAPRGSREKVEEVMPVGGTYQDFPR